MKKTPTARSTPSPIRVPILFCFLAVIGLGASSNLFAVAPQYQIYDIGLVQIGDSASQGFGVSRAGVAVGRSFRTGGTQAFAWTLAGGLAGLPNLSGRSYCVSNSANDSDIVVGTGSTTSFGSGRLPVIWQNGVVSQLPLPAGQTLGDANSVNASGVAAGSVNAGSLQRGVIYSGGSASIITQTTANGSYFLTAFGINNSGRIVGQGIDPNNAARNVGIVYDMGNSMAFEVGALPGMNGALAFGVSNTGYVAGSSMLNQGSGMPFIWSDANGIQPIPLASGTSEGSARAVNSAGWVVGNDSSAFSIPFLYDGTATYRLADLIPGGSGWDLSMNTSSSALGIGDNGIIVGTSVYNGQVHAYAMLPIGPTPTGAVSRKIHGAAGTFDIALPLTGSPGIECRTGGATSDYQMVVTFASPVTVTGNPQAQITAGPGIVGSGGVSNGGMVTVSGNTVTIPLTNVANDSGIITIQVTLFGVNDGSTYGAVMIPMGVRVGDVNGNGAINASDVTLCKSHIGQPVDASNFRADVNISGTINATDTAIIKTNIGVGLR